MILFWRIRYLDHHDRAFKDRDLLLDTEDLCAVDKASVEACYELNRSGSGRGMLKYRHLFKPEATSGELQERVQRSGNFGSVFIHDHFEDENGQLLTNKQLAVSLTGSETAVLLPPGAKEHDIAYILADKPAIDIGEVSLSETERRVLGYFSRDLKEMRSSSFFKEGPGTLSGYAGSAAPMTLKTSVNDEEIRSFVTIFRRLFMEKEPANLSKAARVFMTALAGHPIADWIGAGAAEIEASLMRPPDVAPFTGASNQVTFTVKRLIDVFLYTQYAHQPSESRLRQFSECLQAVRGDCAFLTYLFFSEMFHLALELSNVGQYIAQLFDAYCDHHHLSREIVASPSDAHPGIGQLEKSHEREQRILQEKAEALATTLWKNAGEPSGGFQPFVADALRQLQDAMHA